MRTESDPSQRKAGRRPGRCPAPAAAGRPDRLVVLPVLLAVAFALLLAIGCGPSPTSVNSPATTAQAGPAQTTPQKGAAAPSARLLVSRDFGARVLLDTTAEIKPGSSVMALLASHTKVETGYGGGFVGGIDGLRSTFATAGPGKAADWFYWVDGRLADVGADYFTLQGGETVWWDYHVWSGTAMIPASLSAFPRPFNSGALLWSGPAAQPDLRGWASMQGLSLGESVSIEQPPAGGALMALTLDATAPPSWLRTLLDRGSAAGVFVKLPERAGDAPNLLTALGENGQPTRPLLAAALALPHPTEADTLLLVLLAVDTDALDALLANLSADTARAHVGIGIDSAGALVRLPDDPAGAAGTSAGGAGEVGAGTTGGVS